MKFSPKTILGWAVMMSTTSTVSSSIVESLDFEEKGISDPLFSIALLNHKQEEIQNELEFDAIIESALKASLSGNSENVTKEFLKLVSEEGLDRILASNSEDLKSVFDSLNLPLHSIFDLRQNKTTGSSSDEKIAKILEKFRAKPKNDTTPQSTDTDEQSYKQVEVSSLLKGIFKGLVGKIENLKKLSAEKIEATLKAQEVLVTAIRESQKAPAVNIQQAKPIVVPLKPVSPVVSEKSAQTTSSSISKGKNEKDSGPAVRINSVTVIIKPAKPANSPAPSQPEKTSKPKSNEELTLRDFVSGVELHVPGQPKQILSNTSPKRTAVPDSKKQDKSNLNLSDFISSVTLFPNSPNQKVLVFDKTKIPPKKPEWPSSSRISKTDLRKKIAHLL